jgi:hypothetical protein
MHGYGEEPDFWFVFAIWKMCGEPNLYFEYDGEIGKYIFYFKSTEKQVKYTKNKVYCHYDVKAWVKEEVGLYIPYAKRIIKTVSSKGIYLLKDKERIQQLEDDYETLIGLISWYSDGQYDESNAGMVSEGDKPYFVVGDSDLVIKKLKRMGYKTVVTYDWDGKEDCEWLLDADYGYKSFHWDELQQEIEDFIMDRLQSEFGEYCIYTYDYDENQRIWAYELELNEGYKSSLKEFIRGWNVRKPYGIRCKFIEETPFGCILRFKNGFKYSK